MTMNKSCVNANQCITIECDKYEAEACTKQNCRTKERDEQRLVTYAESRENCCKGDICAGFLKMSKALLHCRKFISGKK